MEQKHVSGGEGAPDQSQYKSHAKKWRKDEFVTLKGDARLCVMWHPNTTDNNNVIIKI